MFDKKNLSERVLSLRKVEGITQSDLASAVGLNRTAVTLIEKGERAASIEVLCALADYFDVSLDYLVGRSDNQDRR